MRNFTFFNGCAPEPTLIDHVVTPQHPLLDPQPPAEFYTAVICASRQTFHEFRESMMSCYPQSIFTYGEVSSFQMDHTKFIYVRSLADIIGAIWTYFTRLHDSNLVVEVDQMVEYLERRGTSERF